MAIGERIRYFRKKRGITQKHLGMQAGLSPSSSEVRITQYETIGRSPRPELTEKIASALNVSPLALNVPDIDSELGLIHTFFALEDMYGLKITELEGTPCLRLDVRHESPVASDVSLISLFRMLSSWLDQAKKLEAGIITKEEYDQWRYYYPQYVDDTEKGHNG